MDGLAIFAIRLWFCVSVPLVLAQGFLAVMNHLPSFVVRDLLEISIIVSINNSRSMNKLTQASRVVGNRQIFDVWFLFSSALGFHSDAVSDSHGFRNRNVVISFGTSTFTARDTLLWRVTTPVNFSAAVGTFNGVDRYAHDG